LISLNLLYTILEHVTVQNTQFHEKHPNVILPPAARWQHPNHAARLAVTDEPNKSTMELPHLLAFQLLTFTFQSLTFHSLTLSLQAHQLIPFSLYTFPFNAQLFLLAEKYEINRSPNQNSQQHFKHKAPDSSAHIPWHLISVHIFHVT
jgi:hypothetical protein